VIEDSHTLVRGVTEFWFGPKDDPERNSMRRDRWFRIDPAFDEEIRRRFLDDVVAAGRGELDGLSSTADGVLTLLILLDQFPRNIFRGTPRMYAYDAKARAVALLAVNFGLDQVLSAVERVFIYLPFEHSENIEDQIRAVTLFNNLPEVPWRVETVDYALRHHDIVARFGRFPHRNAILGRVSTPEEIEFLKEEGSSF
jgi:uncharacterized protein (DUF924 family)